MTIPNAWLWLTSRRSPRATRIHSNRKPPRHPPSPPAPHLPDIHRLGLDQLDIEIQPEKGSQAAGQGQVVGLAEVSPTEPDRRGGRGRRGTGRGDSAHDTTRRARPPSAMTRAMWPNV